MFIFTFEFTIFYVKENSLNIHYVFFLSLPNKKNKIRLSITRLFNYIYIYNYIYHVNYDEDNLRKGGCIIFLRRGSLRHLISFKGYERSKMLISVDLDNVLIVLVRLHVFRCSKLELHNYFLPLHYPHFIGRHHHVGARILYGVVH